MKYKIKITATCKLTGETEYLNEEIDFDTMDIIKRLVVLSKKIVDKSKGN